MKRRHNGGMVYPERPVCRVFTCTGQATGAKRGWPVRRNPQGFDESRRGIRREKGRSSFFCVARRVNTSSGPSGHLPLKGKAFGVSHRRFAPLTGAYRLVLAENGALCRFPGARTPTAMGRLLAGAGAGAGADLPPQRRPYEGQPP